MRLTIIFLVITATLYGQDRKYFTPYFQNMTSEKTTNERKYTFEGSSTVIEDYKNNTLEQRGVIYGLTKLDQVNEFAWYCLSLGNSINYRPYFKNIKGVFDFYANGKISKQVIIKDGSAKFGQVWNNEGQEILISGIGEKVYKSSEDDETVYEKYQDSTLVISYGVRTEKADTIHYTYDKMASPEEGMQNFYQELVRVLKYPGFARLAGKEGRVYVQFIVDEQGNLTDFKPLTKEGFNFESKTIKKLEKLPRWSPAVYNKKFVKTKFILPVKFQLTG